MAEPGSSSTRDALLDAAEQLLDVGGVPAVTLRAVGQAVGVSHNAPYKHFASKDRLLAAVAARELDRLADEMAATAQATPSPAEALRSLLQQLVRWAVAHPQRFRLVYGRWSEPDAELAAAATRAHRQQVAIVAAAQRDGLLPPGDPERTAALLQASAQGAAELTISGHLAADGKGNADPEDLVDDLLGHLAAAARVVAPAQR